MMLFYRTVLTMLLAGFFWLAPVVPAQAQGENVEVDISQSLGFGTFVMRNNNGVYNLQVATDGTPTADAAFLPVEGDTEPQNGVITISGIDGSPVGSIEFPEDPLILTCACGGPDFTIDDFVHEPIVIVDGIADVPFGATLSTSGSGTRYRGGNYTATVEIIVMLDY